MKKVKLILLAILAVLTNRFYAQDSTNTGTAVQVSPAIPVSWTYLDTVFTYIDTATTVSGGANFRTALNSYILPYHSNAVLKQYADSIRTSCTTCSFARYYGYGIENTIDLKSSAQYYNPNIAGGKLWIMRITSSTALGVQFYFGKFNMPNNSFMHIYTADRKKILGPYLSANNPTDSTLQIQFGTAPINSNDVFIEYYEGDSASFSGSFKIANVVHVFSSNFGQGSSCETDLVCSGTSAWNSEAASAALVLIYNPLSQLQGTCSGNLLNNTKQDGTPYFLTAGHCYLQPVVPIGGSQPVYPVGTWQFVFDYQLPCCGDSADPGYNKIIYGATYLASDTMVHCDNAEYGKSDYLFLKLNTDANSLKTWGVCYAGWSIEKPVLGTSDVFTEIHYPMGDVMKLSEGSNLTIPTDIPKCKFDSLQDTWDSTYFYNLDFDEGGPEPGSSGSGLFDLNHHLIGTCTGSDGPDSINVCLSNSSQGAKYYYARFNKQFPNFLGRDIITHTSYNYLDSIGTSTSVPSYCPRGGPKLATCTPGGGTTGGGTVWGPTWTPSPYDCNGIDNGIKINKQTGIPNICDQNQVTLSSLYDIDFWFTSNSTSPLSCSLYNSAFCPPDGPLPDFSGGCHCPGPCSNCFAHLLSYEIDIQQLDFNLNPVGPYYHQSFTEYSYRLAEDFTSNCISDMWGVHEIIFNPSVIGGCPGLQAGSFYSIGISTVNSFLGYQNVSRIAYVMPSSFTANSITVGDVTNPWDVRNIEATSDILIENSTVVPNIGSIEAGNQIKVLDASHLQGGHYFIDPTIACVPSTFRTTEGGPNRPHSFNNSNSQVVVSEPNNTSNIISYQTNSNSSTAFLIYPNPSNENIVLEFNSQLPQSKGALTIYVYNSLGECVKTEQRTFFQAQMGLQVDYLPAGMYNIKVIQGEKNWQSKFVKQ